MQRSWRHEGPYHRYISEPWTIERHTLTHRTTIARDGTVLQIVNDVDTAQSWIQQQEAAEQAERDRQALEEERAREAIEAEPEPPPDVA